MPLINNNIASNNMSIKYVLYLSIVLIICVLFHRFKCAFTSYIRNKNKKNDSRIYLDSVDINL